MEMEEVENNDEKEVEKEVEKEELEQIGEVEQIF